MPITPVERVAAALLALEGLALLMVAGWEVVALVGGDTDDVGSSIALIVLTVVGAAAVVAFAVGVARGQSWGRSGGIVTQLLILAVFLGLWEYATAWNKQAAFLFGLSISPVLFSLAVLGVTYL